MTLCIRRDLFSFLFMRLDIFLVKNKLAPSRERAKNLVQQGAVLCNKQQVCKPNQTVSPTDKIELIKTDFPWVSRAGLKLAHALVSWHIDVKDKICADFGACTGGFTQVLLANDARKVYAIDVGKDQLVPKLRENERVVNMEQTHVKNLTRKMFAEKLDFICIDTSFISLTHVLPKAAELLEENGSIVALIKPQFEVGKKLIKKGVVKDPALHQLAVQKIKVLAQELALQELALIESPILGGKGNKEFLIYLKKHTV